MVHWAGLNPRCLYPRQDPKPFKDYAGSMRRFEFLDHPGPIPFAHRGGPGPWAENTWPAFEHAVNLGYRYIETDAQATSDGVALAFHDDTLDRVTNAKGHIRKLPYREVAKAQIGEERIPLLDEVLSAWPDVRFNIDIKRNSALEPVIQAIRRTRALHRVCINTFSDLRTMRVSRALGPSLCTGVGPIGATLLRLGSLMPEKFPAPTRWTSGAVAQVPVRWHSIPVCDSRFVNFSHRLRLPVHVWTVNDEAMMEKLLNLGVDGLITDRPAVLKRVLLGRGMWFGRA
jgi:glycerophosphoryl diester phosphodiesterase